MSDPLPLGTKVPPYGTVQAVQWMSGERYYFLVNKRGDVAMLPACCVEPEATKNPAKKPAKPLPCPFCGTAAKVTLWLGAWDAYCADLSCVVRPATVKHSSRKLAIAAWNRRAK